MKNETAKSNGIAGRSIKSGERKIGILIAKKTGDLSEG
jgi:hypothetical protein